MLKLVGRADGSYEGSITEALTWVRSRAGDPRLHPEVMEDYQRGLEDLIAGGQIIDLVLEKKRKRVIDKSVRPPRRMSYRQAMAMILEMALGN